MCASGEYRYGRRWAIDFIKINIRDARIQVPTELVGILLRKVSGREYS